MSTSSTIGTRHAAATRLLQSGEYQAAIQLFEALIDERPSDVDLLNDAALAYAQAGDVQQADTCLRQTLDIQPDYQTGFFNLIDLHLDQQDDAAASGAFEKYGTHIPDNALKSQYATQLRLRSSDGIIVRDECQFTPKKHLFIVTQPRSGSTIFWQTFRRDTRLTSYNEPFNPHLRHNIESGKDYYSPKSQTHNQVFKEFLAVPDLMRSNWSTVQPSEELYDRFIDHQVTYVSALLETGDHVCIDFVRCNGKVRHLREAFPDALIVHLVRDPRSWTTSHLRPYGDWLPGLPDNFFCHTGWFNYWSRQRLAQHLSLDGYAHEQLFQIWHRLTRAAEEALPDITVQFEHFTHHPEAVLKTIYQFLDLPYAAIDTSDIRPAKPPFAADDPTWGKAAAQHLNSATRSFIYPFRRDAQSAHPSSRRSLSSHET